MEYQKLPKIEKLSDLSSPPKKLFYQGNLDLEIFEDCVAVVGSRKITDYGKRVVEKIIPQLVFQNKTVVSGFMYGTDQYVHQTCLDNGGKTIAVLGWGITHPLFDYDKKLAEQIVKKNGLLISEWENQKPALWTFPARNRIVAALCDEVIIVEAAVQSGSLITARLARELKRKVWAVPGPITSKASAGTNMLIAAGFATLWQDNQPTKKIIFTNPILQAVENEMLSVDEIARKLNRPVAELGAEISILLLSGQISERSGKYFVDNYS